MKKAIYKARRCKRDSAPHPRHFPAQFPTALLLPPLSLPQIGERRNPSIRKVERDGRREQQLRRRPVVAAASAADRPRRVLRGRILRGRRRGPRRRRRGGRLLLARSPGSRSWPPSPGLRYRGGRTRLGRPVSSDLSVVTVHWVVGLGMVILAA